MGGRPKTPPPDPAAVDQQKAIRDARIEEEQSQLRRVDLMRRGVSGRSSLFSNGAEGFRSTLGG
jgi:hypothetical protein